MQPISGRLRNHHEQYARIFEPRKSHTVSMSTTRIVIPRTIDSLKRAVGSRFSKRASKRLLGSLFLASGTAIAYNEYHKRNTKGPSPLLLGAAGVKLASIPSGKDFEDYQKVYNGIAEKLVDKDDYDDGSYGPVLLRLAWHCSGTYDKDSNTGGSYGGTMRFSKEQQDPENPGLDHGRDFLEEFKEKYPWISYGDLWTLGGVVAVQEAEGPKVKWRAGRQDMSSDYVPPYGRLPDASRDASYVRNLFAGKGLTERETVALIGAHAMGRCHTQASGYDGPWTFSPTLFTNDFYELLLQKWHIRDWDGKKQWQDNDSKSLMMLPTDMALVQDSSFKKLVQEYATDSDKFFSDFSAAFQKLLELGIKFDPKQPEWTFKTLSEQES